MHKCLQPTLHCKKLHLTNITQPFKIGLRVMVFDGKGSQLIIYIQITCILKKTLTKPLSKLMNIVRLFCLRPKRLSVSTQ